MNNKIVDRVINIQTGIELDWDKVDKKISYEVLIKNFRLFEEWDFEKNEELGLDVYYLKRKSDVAWWICYRCESPFNLSIATRNRGQNCSYCAGFRVNHTNSLASLKPEVAKEWHPILNGDLTPHNVTCGKSIKAWWKCSVCKNPFERTINSRNGKD